MLELIKINFSGMEYYLLLAIIFLIMAVLLLMIYALYIRMKNSFRDAYIKIKQNEWEKIILNYLDDNNPGKNTLYNYRIKFKDWIIFAEFVENYLLDLKGEDYEKIITFLWKIGFYNNLMKAIKKSDKWEKSYSAYFLGLMKYQKAEMELIKMALDKSPLVSISSLGALNRIGSTFNIYNFIKDMAANESLNAANISEMIASHGTKINPLLIDLLKDASIPPKAKRKIIDIIVSRGVIESIDTIISLAERSEDTELIIGCIKAMSEFGSENAIPFLLGQLSSQNWVIRSQTVKALGNTGVSDVIPSLKNKLINDNNFFVKLYSAQAIMQFGESGMNELKSILYTTQDETVKKILNYVVFERVIEK
jgi:hypothetical protein